MGGYTLALSEQERARYQVMADVAVQHEAHLWELAGIRAGARIADVGCGPGAVLVKMAALAGASGEVVGVDADPQAVELANEMIRTAGVGNASVHVATATDSGIEPGSCDVVVMRHVIAHNGGKEQQIVDHLATLLRPGGSLYLVDVDVTAIRFSPSQAELVDAWSKYTALHKQLGNNGMVGLELDRLAEQAGLSVTAYEGYYVVVKIPPGFRPPPWAAREAMLAAGVATADDVTRWAAAFDELDRSADPPTLFAPAFVCVAAYPPVGD